MCDQTEKNTEGDDPSLLYTLENKPSGVSWVDKLRSAQAKAQCLAWGLTPAPTLEANRVMLKDYINSKAAQGHSTSQTSLVENLQNKPPVEQVTPQPDWQVLVRATAVAVGEQVAKAFAESGTQRPTAHHGLGNKIVSDMVEALPSISGANARQLVSFLISVNQILLLDLVSPNTVILNILPKTKDQLRSIWSQAIQNKSSASSLIETVLDNFLPGRLRQQTVTDLIYRVQKPNESLAEFANNIQSVADLLLPDCRGMQLLDIVLTGINPPTRARLSGLPAPNTLADLFTLAPRVDVIANTEQQYNRDFLQTNNTQPGDRQRQADQFQSAPRHTQSYGYGRGSHRPNNQYNQAGRGSFSQPNRHWQQPRPNTQAPQFRNQRPTFRPNLNNQGGN